jgi:hypothetical protein
LLGYDVTQNGDLVILDKPGYIEYQGTELHTEQLILMTHMFLLFFTDGILKGHLLKKRDHSNSTNCSKDKKLHFQMGLRQMFWKRF